MPELDVTPGQTIGPFFGYALPYDRDQELVPLGSPGSVRLHGCVYDGAGAGVPDALLEIRHAGPSGEVPRVPGSLRRDGTFTGWGRAATDAAGRYWFSTLEPASGFFAVAVFARGLLDVLFTRIYLPADEAVLADDALLRTFKPDVRSRLVATREPDGSLHFDVHLHGDLEIPFLAHRGR